MYFKLTFISLPQHFSVLKPGVANFFRIYCVWKEDWSRFYCADSVTSCGSTLCISVFLLDVILLHAVLEVGYYQLISLVFSLEGWA